MFGFLIGNEVNDDAVRLKAIADRAVAKYAHLSIEDARKAVDADFEAEMKCIANNQCVFVYREAACWQFWLDCGSQKTLTLSAHGRGKYLGSVLRAADGGASWCCWAKDGIAYNATGGAKKLASVMQKKFGITDISRFMRQFGV